MSSVIQLEDAIAFLRAGVPVAIPTETVYGLAAPIDQESAIQKIFSLKGRPADNPLIVHVSSRKMVDAIAQNIPSAFELLTRFWPGPLTVVLPKAPSLSPLISGGHETVAVRMPSHPLALALIEAVGPVVAPSANLSGCPSPTTAAHVLEDLVVPVLDGGPCSIGLESTVLSLVHPQPTILRPGAITQSMLEEALGCSIALPEADSPILSPGMKYRHYAPKARLRIAEGKIPPHAFVIAPNSETFYAKLREADRLNIEEIWIQLNDAARSDPALMDRLLRAMGDKS